MSGRERKKITPSELARIEAELDILLPEDYKSVLLADALDGWMEELFCEADRIITETQFDRTEGFCGLDWPKHYLAIGANGAGDLYFIDLSRSPSPVYFVDHETAAISDRWDITEKAATIEAWVEKVQVMKEEFIAWKAARNLNQ